MGRSSNSSSGEEDGDAEWRAAIDSVATDFNLTTPKTINGSTQTAENDYQKEKNSESPTFKLYQIKAQKLLEDLLDKNLVMVRDPTPALERSPERSEGGIRLFKQAPPGILFDPIDAYPRPSKRPRIVPTEEIEEKSKKFRHRVESIVVDGIAIMAAAKDACQRSLARFEAKDAAAKAAAKREEQRITELIRLRGEKWLPSIAREMQVYIKFPEESCKPFRFENEAHHKRFGFTGDKLSVKPLHQAQIMKTIYTSNHAKNIWHAISQL